MDDISEDDFLLPANKAPQSKSVSDAFTPQYDTSSPDDIGEGDFFAVPKAQMPGQMYAVGTGAGRNIIPSLVGLGTGALGGLGGAAVGGPAAPATAFAGAMTAGAAGAYGAAEAQNALVPPGLREQLAALQYPGTYSWSGLIPGFVTGKVINPKALLTKAGAIEFGTEVGSEFAIDAAMNAMTGQEQNFSQSAGQALAEGILQGRQTGIGRAISQSPIKLGSYLLNRPTGPAANVTPEQQAAIVAEAQAAAAPQASAQQPATLPRITIKEARAKYPNGYDGEVVWPDGRVTGWSGTVEATVNMGNGTAQQAAPAAPTTPAAEAPASPVASVFAPMPVMPPLVAPQQQPFTLPRFAPPAPQVEAPQPAPAVIEKPEPNVFEAGVAELNERIRFIKGEIARRQGELDADVKRGRANQDAPKRIERLKASLADAEAALERLKDRNAPRSELPPPVKEPSAAEVLAQKKTDFDKITRQLEAAHRRNADDETIAILEADQEQASIDLEAAQAAYDKAQAAAPATPAPKPVVATPAPKPAAPQTQKPASPALVQPDLPVQPNTPAPQAKPTKPGPQAQATPAVSQADDDTWQPRKDKPTDYENADRTGVIEARKDGVFVIYQTPRPGIRETVGYAKSFERAKQIFAAQAANRNSAPQDTGNNQTPPPSATKNAQADAPATPPPAAPARTQTEIPGTAETFNLAGEQVAGPRELTPEEQAARNRENDTTTGTLAGTEDQPAAIPSTPEREAKINAILDNAEAADQSYTYEIKPIYELKGSDGKWYRPQGFPYGVKNTGEKRIQGYAPHNQDGISYGKMYPTEAEAEANMEAGRKAKREEFRKSLEQSDDARLDEQAKFWESERATFDRRNPDAVARRQKSKPEPVKQPATEPAATSQDSEEIAELKRRIEKMKRFDTDNARTQLAKLEATLARLTKTVEPKTADMAGQRDAVREAQDAQKSQDEANKNTEKNESNEPPEVQLARRRIDNPKTNPSRYNEAVRVLDQYENDQKLANYDRTVDIDKVSDEALGDFLDAHNAKVEFNEGEGIETPKEEIEYAEAIGRYAERRFGAESDQYGDLLADMRNLAKKGIALPVLPKWFKWEDGRSFSDLVRSKIPFALKHPPLLKADEKRARTDGEYRNEIKKQYEGMVEDYAQALAQLGWTQASPDENSSWDAVQDLVGRAIDGEKLAPKGGVGGVPAKSGNPRIYTTKGKNEAFDGWGTPKDREWKQGLIDQDMGDFLSDGTPKSVRDVLEYIVDNDGQFAPIAKLLLERADAETLSKTVSTDADSTAGRYEGGFYDLNAKDSKILGLKGSAEQIFIGSGAEVEQTAVEEILHSLSISKVPEDLRMMFRQAGMKNGMPKDGRRSIQLEIAKEYVKSGKDQNWRTICEGWLALRDAASSDKNVEKGVRYRTADLFEFIPGAILEPEVGQVLRQIPGKQSLLRRVISAIKRIFGFSEADMKSMFGDVVSAIQRVNESERTMKPGMEAEFGRDLLGSGDVTSPNNEADPENYFKKVKPGQKLGSDGLPVRDQGKMPSYLDIGHKQDQGSIAWARYEGQEIDSTQRDLVHSEWFGDADLQGRIEKPVFNKGKVSKNGRISISKLLGQGATPKEVREIRQYAADFFSKKLGVAVKPSDFDVYEFGVDKEVAAQKYGISRDDNGPIWRSPSREQRAADAIPRDRQLNADDVARLMAESTEGNPDSDLIPRPKPNTSVARQAQDIVTGRYFSGLSSKAHQNAERTGSAAVKAVANIIHARPGTKSNAFEADLPTATMTKRTEFQNRFNKIMSPLRETLAGFKDTDAGSAKDQREQVYKALTDMITGRKPITQGKLGEAATGLKNLLADLHAYRTEAGEKLGNVNDYYPAVYDSGLIGANREAFTRDATRAYEIELSKLSDEELAKEAGVLPSDLQPQLSGMGGKDRKTLITEIAKAKAEGLYQFHQLGGDQDMESIFGAAGRGGAENPAASRVFGREAQAIMSKYQVADPFRVVGRYIGNGVKRAELVRRFGNDGKKWQAMAKQMIAEGADQSVVDEMRDLVRIAAGVGIPPRGKAGQAYVDTVTLLTAASAMGRGFMNNLVEPVSMGIRTGSPLSVLRAYGETWARFLREVPSLSPAIKAKLGDTFWQQYGETIGTIHNSIEDAWMTTHSMDLNADEADPRMRWLTNRIYKANLMDASEVAKQQASHAIGYSFIKDLANWSKGQHWMNKTFGVDPKQTVADQLNELGVPPEKHAEFADWVLALDNAKGDARMARMTENSEMARMHREAMTRFSYQSSVRSNRAHRPTFQDDLLGKTLLQLMNFSYSYAAEVNTRVYDMAKQGVMPSPDGKDYNVADRVRLMGPALGAALAVAAYRGLLELKDLLYPTESTEKRAKDPAVLKWANAASYSGIFGPKIEQAMKYIKRDQTPGGPAGQIARNVGRAATSAIDAMAEGNDFSAAKKQATKAAIPLIKGGVVAGASAVNPVLGGAAVQATNMTNWSNSLAEAADDKKPAGKGYAPKSYEK